ncbi:hypothetical protein A2996_02325 [Candidatus Campbellbacteria bacterium RIFCSPLOWO2_01_FULL_34_15]|uniref:DUF397 domain-containing protein n=4 Tax=Candidatus Campbelliibacteriota TaxID=1752727 RepID=A0A1F5ENF8_9BACT|nr:MAG: hypothetical protein A3E89_01485 [Candidatus Campbellbacteria bacterium RIFCSPHIGHO2_12_FULL_35_10]OGD68850.1 MAG: hypothetical protein A2996_02325 [Candidatus Campbellbacteria bacterium RIFCSPLOWO2_01_FULL_34_15]OGD69094.1 MAG: hypothetical protein A2811_02225 [Candidatus Campbellbacteria bacterium RIFCSPHIGHO2_01_FULL_34_10]OGD69787.1 MAG: hypothetical protein A3I18_01570 [Candidatus Campbellbacteria bacterium RIFCSPLOWO2_02_FULL_35_11]
MDSKKDFVVHDSDFKKSSWSRNNPKTCVMVAIKPEGVAIRDSKDPSKQTLFFSHDEWGAFVQGVKGDEF